MKNVIDDFPQDLLWIEDCEKKFVLLFKGLKLQTNEVIRKIDENIKKEIKLG